MSRTVESVARALRVGAWAAFACLLAGTLAMLVAGIEPDIGLGAPTSAVDPAASLLGLAPAVLTWAGIAVTVVMPVAAVVVAGVSYRRDDDRRAAASAALVIALMASALVVAGAIR